MIKHGFGHGTIAGIRKDPPPTIPPKQEPASPSDMVEMPFHAEAMPGKVDHRTRVA